MVAPGALQLGWDLLAQAATDAAVAQLAGAVEVGLLLQTAKAVPLAVAGAAPAAGMAEGGWWLCECAVFRDARGFDGLGPEV